MNTRETLSEVSRRSICAIHRAVLTSCAAEGYLQVAEATRHKTLHMVVYEPIHTLEEGQYLAVLLKIVHYLLISARQVFIGVISPGVVRRAAVEHIPSTVSRLVLGNPFLKGERIDGHGERHRLRLMEVRSEVYPDTIGSRTIFPAGTIGDA